jgi:hypothetical protein
MNTEHDKPTPPPGFKLVKACELKAPFSDRLLVSARPSVATSCYAYADAMLAAREVKP